MLFFSFDTDSFTSHSGKLNLTKLFVPCVAIGMVYMQKCGTSRLEDAGDCFAMAECWPEAAEVAKHKGDILLEVDMLEKADLFEDATQLLLLHIIVDSLWSSNGRGWPPRRYTEKEQLLAKAKEMAKKVSECFYCSVCLEADALSDVNKSLPNLTSTFLEGRKCANLLVELFASRLILDVHLQSRASGYNLELGPESEDENSCNCFLCCHSFSGLTMYK